MHAALRAAVADFSWLLGRGYPERSALALVGNRFSLTGRQRLAVQRAACTDEARLARAARRTELAALRGRALWIDGFNVLITVEAALAGGVLLRCRDGCLRDMASIHGSYRTVAETALAGDALATAISELRLARCRILLDRSVSNSGRARAALLDAARSRGLDWSVELTDDVDRELRAAPDGVVIASADAGVLGRCGSWTDLASGLVARCAPHAAPIALDP
jgi:hypothetical protein